MAGPTLAGKSLPSDGSLPNSARIPEGSPSFHAYLHIPFCKVRCGYCDFNTYVKSELRGISQSSFADVIAREIVFSESALRRSSIDVPELTTIFFGGGTPSQLPASQLVGLVRQLKTNFGLAEKAEITTEANPDDISADFLRELSLGGFTRISIGMQSAVDSVLKTLDRSHNPTAVAPAVQIAKDLGLNVSLDIIYGSPGETLDDFKQTVEAVLKADPGHVSAYSLIVEEGTKMHRRINSGELPEPDPDLQASMYEYLDEVFGDAGYQWYELSNFARATELRSRHNLAYWQGQNWWGYGPGAHSHMNGTRWWNVKHPSAYSERLSEQVTPAQASEELSGQAKFEELVMLRLRIRNGLRIAELLQHDSKAMAKVESLVADGLVDPTAVTSGYLNLTLRGRLLADRVASNLLFD